MSTDDFTSEAFNQMKKKLHKSQEQPDELQSRINSMSDQNEDLKASLRDKEKVIEERDLKIREMTASVAELRKTAEHLGATLTQIYASKTWKIGQFYGRWVPDFHSRIFRFTGLLDDHWRTHWRIVRHEGLRNYLKYSYDYRKKWLRDRLGLGGRASGGRGDIGGRNVGIVPSTAASDLNGSMVRAGGIKGRVSIVLPVYNQAVFLKDAIEGALNQTYRNFELIIVNDGSTDGVETIFDEYLTHPQVKIFTQPNQKLPSALNNGFRYATGEYYTWTSADNIMLPDQIEELVGFLERNLDADMVFSDYEVMNDQGEPLNDPLFRPHNQDKNAPHIMRLPKAVTFENLHDSGDNFIGPSFMYRRHIAKIIGDYSHDTFGGEDYDYWLRINSLFRIRHLDKVLYRYRVHANTLNARAQELNLYDNVARVLERDRKRRDFYGRAFRVIGSGDDGFDHRDGSPDKILLVFKFSQKNGGEIQNYLGHPRSVSVCVVDNEMDEFLVDDKVLKACDYIITGCKEDFEILCASHGDKTFIAESSRLDAGMLIKMANSRLFGRISAPLHQKMPASVYTEARRLCIALQVENFDRGGMEQIVYDLAACLNLELFTPIVIVVNNNGLMGEKLKSKGIEVVMVHGELDVYEKVLRDHKIDLISTHFSYFGLDRAREMGIGIVETVHNNYTWLGTAEIERVGHMSRCIDRHCAVSRQVQNHHRRRFGISPLRMGIIPNGLNLEGLEGPPRGIYNRKHLGFDDGDFIFLNVASFSSVKAHKLMLCAMRDLSRRHKNLKLVFVGDVMDHGLYQRICNLIKDWNLTDTVKVLNYMERPDLRDIYSMADCFVLPSLVEGWSVAAMEAMYFNLPLILTDVGSARDLINPEAGIIIKNSYSDVLSLSSQQLMALSLADDFSNLEDLKTAMLKIFEDHDTWKEKSGRSRERVLSEFSVGEMVKRYEEVFIETCYVIRKTNFESPEKSVSTTSATPSDKHEHITYEYLGIDPRKFYDGKFMGGNENRNYLKDIRNKFDIEFSRIRFLAEHISGGRVLDLGCGSGHYGRTLKEECQVSELIGIDMDEKALEKAKSSYDKTYVFTLDDRLPFDDNYFDAVFSVDFFGHVEFRSKDALIQEIFRVTKPCGLSVHVIESGDLDYSAIDLTNPGDKLAKYIKMEGHVGIEPAEKIKKRWERYFEVLALENAFIYPLYPIYTYLADKTAFDPVFCSILENSSENERRLAQVCLGYANDHMKQVARDLDPFLLMPAGSDGSAGTKMKHREFIDKIFRKPCGLLYFVGRKRDNETGLGQQLTTAERSPLDEISLTQRMKDIIHAHSGSVEGMMDEWELSELVRSLMLSNPCESEIILELGTYKGNTASLISEVLQTMGKNNLTVCIDAFDMVVPDDYNPRGSLEQWLDRNSQKMTILIRSFTADAAAFMAPGCVSFLLIDAFHEYESVCQDISLYLQAVKKGGIIFIDDYNEKLYPGVFRATNELLVNNAEIETIKLSYYAVFRKK